MLPVGGALPEVEVEKETIQAWTSMRCLPPVVS
jgi:hypothetical protein